MKNLLLPISLLFGAGVVTGAEVEYPAVADNVEFAAVFQLPFRSSDYQIPYGDDPLQLGELWLPESPESAKGLLMLIHGGCWLNEFDIAHTYPLSTALADAGYGVWSLEYRRTGDEGGGWPGTYEDIIDGLDFMASLGEYQLPLRNIAVMGHSAGGHLALLAGSDKDNTEVKIDAVIGLAAITDVISYADGDTSCQMATPLFMGGSFEEKPQDYRDANPSSYTLNSNTYLLQGDQDQIVPITQATLVGAETRVFSGASHFDWIHPGSTAYKTLLQLLEDAL